MILVAPSILSADFANLALEIEKVESAGADWLHIDVMDGAFVPNLTLGAPVVKKIRPYSKLFFDAHLMIFNPEKHVDDFVAAGSDLITIHMEAHTKPNGDYDLEAIRACLTKIKAHGIKVGISINPATPVAVLEAIIQEVNLVLLMSVNPGFGGQKFKPEVYQKIEDLKNLLASKGLKPGLDMNAGEIVIEVDGGVILGEITNNLKAAGVNVLVAGSAIYGSDNIPLTIKELKQ